eukprot:592839-Karenia_brevis.AAC.1
MSPRFSAFGGWSYLNRHIHPNTWQQTLDASLELGRFCGRMAMHQYVRKRDWLNEQPSASDLYKYNPWPQVQANPRTVVARFHQCQLGAKTRSNKHIFKPTDIWASDYDL